jgi:hypothetical protein
MKIYTEVIYFWDDDKGELVQESSKFYDYDGPLTLANDSSTGIMDPTTSAQTPVQYLEYPSDIGNYSGGGGTDNWISFEAFSFTSQMKSLDIALYIPGDALNTSYKSEYESVALGGLGAMADKAVKAMQNEGKAGGMTLDNLKSVIGAQASAAGSESGKVGLLKAGEKANILVEGSKTIMERAQGAVLNPYIVAAYKGPTDMRTHDFSFQMLPQDVNESKACIKIVNAFKQAMLPSHGGGDAKTSPSMMFGYPDQFTIQFYINGAPLPDTGLNPMFNVGKSVLLGCDLDFNTESVPLFFDGTQYPVTISMKLSFMELEVMYRERIKQGA